MVMKYMLVMRATDEAFASMADADFGKMLEIVGKFNEELIRAGVLLAAEGLADAAEGVVVDFSSEPPVITDGPYGETKELFGGFYLLNVASKEEAVERSGRGWLTWPAGTPSRRSGGSSPRGSSARSPGTPGTSRWPRTSPRRPWRRHW